MSYESDLLSDEEDIVWLEDPERFDYVREQVLDGMRRPRGRPAWWWHQGRLIGYARLIAQPRFSGGPRTKRATYSRRVFWLAPHDRDSDPNGVYKTGAPAEAVDPRTIKPKVAGQTTTRAFKQPRNSTVTSDGDETKEIHPNVVRE